MVVICETMRYINGEELGEKKIEEEREMMINTRNQLSPPSFPEQDITNESH